MDKIKLNYWKNSPVVVSLTDTNIDELDKNIPHQIIPDNEIFSKMTNIIESHPYKLDYMVNDPNLNLDTLCNFINNNYTDDNTQEQLEPTYKFLYTKDFIKYYTTDALTISFYSKQTNLHESKMIGLIIGKKSKLFIKEKEFDCVEANFLILNPKVRNKNLATLIVSILLKELVLNYSLSIAHYTINNPIKAPHYNLKYYYHRMINIDKLYQSNFISQNTLNLNNFDADICNLLNQYKHTYNNFIDYLPEQQILYLNKKNISMITQNKLNELINIIFFNVNSYSQNKYIIYEYKTREQISQLLSNESFHHFIFLKKNLLSDEFNKNTNIIYNFNLITDYICINELEILNVQNNISYKNGYIYTGFYSSDINMIIEKLSLFVYTNNIVDVITWSDFFDINNSQCIAVKGSGFLKYYLYNIQMYKISNNLNGLVTL